VLVMATTSSCEESFLIPKMTSATKAAANQRNAAKSSGPKTAQGKMRTRSNALRHGLAANTLRNPATSAEVERLATWLCGEGATPEQYEHARAAAESHIQLQRVEAAYVAILERAASAAHRAADQDQTKLGGSVPRDTPAGAPPRRATPTEIDALGVALPQLLRLDRYMQRALARRRRAMQAFVLASVTPRS
jgi:hypothetical protein